MMEKQKYKWLILPAPVIALVFEIIPYGVKLIFSDGPENDFKQYVYTYSYFHIMPLAYGNWGPMITGVLTAIIIILMLIWCIKKNDKWSKAVIILTIIAFCTSLWIFGFTGAYTWISLVISLLLLVSEAVTVIAVIVRNRVKKT